MPAKAKSRARAPRGTMKTTRLRKIECTSCDLILRGSRQPLLDVGLPVCGCGAPMRWADLEDAVSCLPDAELSGHPAYQELREAEQRKALRESTRLTYQALHCGGCRAFVPAVNHACGCGFVNEIRGRRNHGYWRDGGSDGMPF